MPFVGRGHLQAEQPGQRQVDLLDLGQVDRLAEAAQSGQVVVVQGQRGRGPQRAPAVPVDDDVRRRGGRGRTGRRLLHGRIPCHPCAASWATSASSRPSEVVIEGLRRLEYRGYDSAGVALISDGKLVTEKRAGKLANLEAALAESPLGPATTGIGSHPVGHPRRAQRPQRPPAPRLHRLGRGHPQRHHRELRPAARRARGARPRSSPATPTPRSVAHLLEEECRVATARSTWPRRCAGVCHRLEGAFTLVATHVDAPDVVVGARRNSPLVVGRGDGENFLASDVAAFIAHTREAVELGQDQVVELRRDSVTVTDFDGNPGDVHGVPRRLGPLGRREGRLRLLHAQGDRRAAAGRGRHHARPARRRRPARPRRDAASPTTTCARSTRSSSSPAARRSTPDWWRSTPSSTGPGSRARSSWRRSSATATRSSPARR